LGIDDPIDVFQEDDFWWCACCYSCEAHCPQGVPLTHILIKLKQIAFQLGAEIPENYSKAWSALCNGYIISLSEETKKKRKKLGLPEFQHPNTQIIQRILETTKNTQSKP
jgi:heterodisulfide reductase subunit C